MLSFFKAITKRHSSRCTEVPYLISASLLQSGMNIYRRFGIRFVWRSERQAFPANSGRMLNAYSHDDDRMLVRVIHRPINLPHDINNSFTRYGASRFMLFQNMFL